MGGIDRRGVIARGSEDETKNSENQPICRAVLDCSDRSAERATCYRIFIKDLRFSRLLLCALAIASHLSFARNDRLRVLFVIASEAKQSLSKPQLFSEVSIAQRPMGSPKQAGGTFYRLGTQACYATVRSLSYPIL